MRRTVLVAACLAFAQPLSGTPLRQASIASDVYVVRCDGHIDIVDSADGRVQRRVDLAAKLPIEHALGVAGATFDNCLLNGSLYAPRQHAFYARVPDHFSEPQRFGLWRFTVPGLDAHEVRPPFADAADLPELTLAVDGSVKTTARSAMALVLDVSGYRGAAGRTVTRNIARSGTRVLVQLVAPNQKGLSFGVADTAHHVLTVLQRLPPTTERFIHLAPGGHVVIVERVTGGGATARGSGTLTIYDADTGFPRRDLLAPRTIAATFVAIAPDGHALYRRGDDYIAIDLGVHFDATMVETVGSLDSYFIQ